LKGLIGEGKEGRREKEEKDLETEG